MNIVLIAVLEADLLPASAAGAAGVQAATTIMVDNRRDELRSPSGWCIIYAFSTVAGISWFGRAERPVLVDRRLSWCETCRAAAARSRAKRVP